MYNDEFLFNNDDFISKWRSLKPCNNKQAKEIAKKLRKQEIKCNVCKRCVGKKCNIYTTSEEEAQLGKFLIQHIKKF